MLKLGIIGHFDEVKEISAILNELDTEIDPKIILFNTFSEKPEIIKNIKKSEGELDALLFSNKVTFEIINASMTSSIPWVYIKKDENLLLMTLLKLSIKNNKDIKKMSFDTFDQKTIDKIYQNIGFKQYNDVVVADYDLFNQNFIEDLTDFHREHYQSSKNITCLTTLNQVASNLKALNVDVIHLKANQENIKEAINHLSLKIESKKNERSQTVVLSIRIDPINDYSLIHENEYQVLLEKTKVTQKIYLFAQKIQASVVEVGLDQYFLFCTKSILETETDNFKQLDILTNVANDTSSTISLGIGYGITVREAKINAQDGMKTAYQKKGNQAFIVYNNEMIGPITSDYESPETNTASMLDEKYNTIAEQVNISVNTIFKLHCIIDETNKSSFTSKELSGLLDITPRSVNRILNKLERKGYAEVIGKKIISGAGRPSRIIQLNF